MGFQVNFSELKQIETLLLEALTGQYPTSSKPSFFLALGITQSKILQGSYAIFGNFW